VGKSLVGRPTATSLGSPTGCRPVRGTPALFTILCRAVPVASLVVGTFLAGALVADTPLTASPAGASTHNRSAGPAWVTTEGSVTEPGSAVTPVNLSSHRAERKVTIGNLPAAASLPSAMAFTRDDADLLVVARGDDILSEVDPSTRNVVHSATVGLEPDAVAVAPGFAGNEGLALVANFGSNTVTPVDLDTWRAGEPIPVGTEPVAIAVARGEGTGAGTAFVADFGSNLVTPIDLATLQAGAPIAVGQSPQTLAVAGDTVLVGNFGNDTLTAIDATTLQPGATVALPTDPTGIAVTSSGTMAYISGGASVVPLVVAGLVVGKPIAMPGVTQAIALGRSDKAAWVAIQTGSLVEVILSTGKVARTIHLGAHPSALVIPTG
jgi:hyaluronoglucosaminidase